MSGNVANRLGTRAWLEWSTLSGALRRYRRPLVIAPLVTSALFAGLAVAGTEHAATSSFLPQLSGSGSRLAGVAAQFGFTVGGATSGETVEFYAALLRSRELLREVARTEFRIPREPGSRDTLRGTWMELNGIVAETPTARMKGAVAVLKGRVSVRTDAAAGLVTLVTTSRWPGLAEATNRRLIELLTIYNLERRRSQAATERLFTEQRLAEARGALARTESELTRFLTTNRSFQASPRLTFDAARLRRQVEMERQVVTTLAQAAEQASIDEIRDTPLITLVDQPEGSARPTAAVLSKIVLGALVGLVLVAGVLVVREYFAAERERDAAGYAELTVLARAAWDDLRPWRRFGRGGAT